MVLVARRGGTCYSPSDVGRGGSSRAAGLVNDGILVRRGLIVEGHLGEIGSAASCPSIRIGTIRIAIVAISYGIIG